MEKHSEVEQLDAPSEIKEIRASDIHACLLDGLIPVNAPVFYGVDGQVKTCAIYKFDFVMKNYTECTIDDMRLIRTAVQIAKNCGWMYLFNIFQTGSGHFIRGC